MADALPTPGYAADAPRPPIGFSVDLPDHWTVIDLDPATQEGWLDAFLDRRLASRPHAEVERGPARAVLLGLLHRLHLEGVFLGAILAGEVGGELVSASATLAWRRPDLGGDPVDLEGLRQVYLRAPDSPGEDRSARRVELVELPVGRVVKVTSREMAPVPAMTKIRSVAVTQYLVPVSDDGWLAVVTATTGAPALEAGVEEVAEAIAASLRFESSPVQAG